MILQGNELEVLLFLPILANYFHISTVLTSWSEIVKWQSFWNLETILALEGFLQKAGRRNTLKEPNILADTSSSSLITECGYQHGIFDNSNRFLKGDSEAWIYDFPVHQSKDFKFEQKGGSLKLRWDKQAANITWLTDHNRLRHQQPTLSVRGGVGSRSRLTLRQALQRAYGRHKWEFRLETT